MTHYLVKRQSLYWNTTLGAWTPVKREAWTPVKREAWTPVKREATRFTLREAVEMARALTGRGCVR